MYNRFESEHSFSYEDESSKQRDVIEICDINDKKNCLKHEIEAEVES